jgi:hypothetical protein
MRNHNLNCLKLLIIPIILLLSYKINLQNIIKNQGQVLEGPQEKYAEETFNYIRESLPVDVTYAFSKHHAFKLYTERNCIPYRNFQTAREMNLLFEKHDVKYLVYINNICNEKVLDLTEGNNARYKLTWQNENCKIFEHL